MRANMGEAGDVPLDDLEGLLREINEFCSSVTNKPDDIPLSLERYLNYVARSGNTVFPWQHVRPLFRSKILQSMGQFPGEVCPNNESFVLERFDLFRAAPFTIQRLSELITQPTRHYKKKEKFIRGLEKTVLVVSTVEPWSVENDIRNGNDSASDGEMDQTYSESDDSSANRTFTMDQHNEILVTPGGMQGDHRLLQSVTTTMINITSNGTQSTTTIGTTSTSSSSDGISSHMSSHSMSSSELGLSEVITSDDITSDNLIQTNSVNLLPSNNIIEQVGEPVPTILGQGLVPSDEIQDIAAAFEPVVVPDELAESQNHQISSNLITVNITEQVDAGTLSSVSIVQEITESITTGSVEVPIGMELGGEIPVTLPESVVDDSSTIIPEPIGNEGQLTTDSSEGLGQVQVEAVDEGVKQDLISVATPPIESAVEDIPQIPTTIVEPIVLDNAESSSLEQPLAGFEANAAVSQQEIPPSAIDGLISESEIITTSVTPPEVVAAAAIIPTATTTTAVTGVVSDEIAEMPTTDTNTNPEIITAIDSDPTTTATNAS